MPAPSGQNRTQSSGLADIISELVDKHIASMEKFKKARIDNPERFEIAESLAGGIGSIKAIQGLSKLGVVLGGKSITNNPPQTGVGVGFKPSASLNRTAQISETGGLRRNVGGQRPPDSELEELALRKQSKQVQEKARPTPSDKDLSTVFEFLKKGNPSMNDAQIAGFLQKISPVLFKRFLISSKKALLKSPPKGK